MASLPDQTVAEPAVSAVERSRSPGVLIRELFTNLIGRGESRADQPLPDRVKQLIKSQDEASERLISWVQLAIASMLAALYLIAPRPADAPVQYFSTVTLTVLAYLTVTLVRLWLSYIGRLPRSLVVLSILIDLLLLLTLIWIFHTEYDQPAAFSLKVPTFLYIFVFIALRALRFDHRYVLAAGLTAALGWIGIVTLAIYQQGTASITRNFVTYMTSNSFLVGAEVDKVIVVLMVTGILTFAVWRARQTLVVAVKEAAAAREIGRFLSQGVAQAITNSADTVEAGNAIERQAAIIMLDIRGFTRLSQVVPPRLVVDILTSFHARVLPIVDAEGGVVDKFLGDGVMITFGAIEPQADAAARAVRALAAIMAEAKKWSAGQELEGRTLAVNGALTHGPVVFAALGNATRLEYTVIGEAVNLAAKLEKHNKVELTRALMSAGAFEAGCRQDPEVAEAASAFAPIGNRTIAGVSEPLALMALS